MSEGKVPTNDFVLATQQPFQSRSQLFCEFSPTYNQLFFQNKHITVSSTWNCYFCRGKEPHTVCAFKYGRVYLERYRVRLYVWSWISLRWVLLRSMGLFKSKWWPSPWHRECPWPWAYLALWILVCMVSTTYTNNFLVTNNLNPIINTLPWFHQHTCENPR